MLRVLFTISLVISTSTLVMANNYEENLHYYGIQAVKKRLKDPKSAEFSDVRVSGNILCGAVNSKNSFGAYAGRVRFMTTSQDQATFLENDMNPDDFEHVWNIKCKT